MRRQSAPKGLRLAVLLFFAANLKTSSSQYLQNDHITTQAHLVCKKPESQLCVTWHLGPVDADIIIKESPSNATQFCGLSDLKRILPHRKFITVKSLARDAKSKIVFCNGFTKLKGDVINWKQVEKTLNALSRTRRQTASLPRGRYRGQTQSQYLAIDRGNGKDEGKAEAHSAADSSRASVSGNSGMGQAQSQSIYDPNCDDCYGKSDHEVESLKRGPYAPGSGGNRYSPADGYGSSGSYRPGQGSNNGANQQVDVARPGVGYAPGGNGAFVPGHSPGGSAGGNGVYGPNSQGSSGGYGPGQGSGPGTLNYGPSSGSSPGVSQNGNGGYGPGGQQGGTVNYGPGQGRGPGSGYGPTLGTTPGGTQGASGGYGPGQGSGPGSGYGSSPGKVIGGSQGGNGGYSPGQGNGHGSGYGPPSGMIPGSNQGAGGGFVTGQASGPGSNFPSSGTMPGSNLGGSGGYVPGQLMAPGSVYGPSSGTIPVSSQGGSGGYGPGQGSGPGTTIYSPSSRTSPGGGQVNGPYEPGIQQGGNGVYGPGQGTRPGTSGYSPSSGTIPSGAPGGSGSYGPIQGNGQNTGYTPGQNSGIGIVNYGNRPSGNGQGVTPTGNQGPGSVQSRLPDGNIYNSGQVQPNGSFDPGLNGPTGGSTFRPQQTYVPGQTLGGTYNPIKNGNLSGKGGYPTHQIPITNSGYGPIQSVMPGSNVPVPPGGNIGSNWPLALGPYPGPPGSSIYCCVVPNNYGQNTGQDGKILPSTGSGYPPYASEQTRPAVVSGSNELQPPYSTKPSGVPSNLYGPSYGPGNTGSTQVQSPQLPGTYDKGLIGGRINQEPYGIGINGPSNPYGRDVVGGLAPYGPGNTGGAGNQNGMQSPGNFGTGLSEGPGAQNNLMGPGNYVPVAGVGNQNGMQAPGSYATGTPGGSGGQNGMSGPHIYGTGIYQDPRIQPGLRQPSISGGIESQIPGSGRGQPGVQNGLQGPGNFGSSPNGGSSQNGMQGPGNFGVGPVAGLGQNGAQGPINFGTGPTGGSGNQNGIQIPGVFETGPSGGLEGHNGIQRPGNYVSGTMGEPNHFVNQGSGVYSPGTSGGSGGQNNLQETGNYGTSGGPGGQNNMQRPGSYSTGTPGDPNSQNSVQGSGTFNGQSVPNNLGGGGQNTGNIGGPGTYGTQNGNLIPSSGPSGGYTGGTQFPPSLQGPGGGNTGFYGQQPQGSINSSPAGSQQGFDSQGNLLHGNEYNGMPQNYVDPNSIAIDGDDSEAEAIVNQAANGTTASASSKGGNDKGRAQTHVHGTYTGGGSFQAQAQITGENKEAESEVSGGKKGASSSATGSGRKNKSQASVQLGSESGSIQTQSQSNGAMHSSNSQVQGSVKGGMADAQAKGPGSTSSQAQIGFTPYKDGDKVHELLQTPFVGGGIASAQSSGRTGQSQSQLHGTFKYGITYSGAAQAGASLDKDATFPNKLNFEKIDVFDESQKNINVNSENPQKEIPSTESTLLLEVPIESKTNMSNADEVTTTKAGDETMKNSESRYLSHTHLDHHRIDTTSSPPSTAIGSRRSFQSGYENGGADYEYTTDKDEIQPEEYDTDPGYGVEGNDASDVEQGVGEEFPNYDEYSRDYQTHQSLQTPHRNGIEVQQSTGGNTQHIVLGSLNNHDAEITQRNSEKPDESKVYQPGERVPGTGGYRIPIGFTGSVKSVASKEKTYVVGSKHSPSQAQTVTLTPGTGKVNYVYPTNYRKYVNPKDLRSLHSQNSKDDRYVSVSKSVTRALDGEDNIRKQYSHTYYTKSSSCGYFTFTCTMVSGVDGRKKVCKPKIPTNPDGTPIRC